VGFLLTFYSKYVIVELTNINKHMNKYTKWYRDITENAKQRVINDRTERHHIKPRSLGGADTSDNLVDLTPREHFICHWLLVKMTTGKDHHKMLNALRMMRAENPNQQRYNTKITSRVYESIKKEYAELQSVKLRGAGNGMYGKTQSAETREKIRQKNLGKKLTAEQIENLKKAITGKKKPPLSTEHRAKLSANHRSKQADFDGTLSKETRAKISAKAIGRKQSEETIKAKADAIRGSKREKKLCLHCSQLVAVNGYARWHGINCKRNPHV
jgi:5-methylcytosine-specific restriction endonuclease McrA